MRLLLLILAIFIGADAYAADIEIPSGAQIDRAYDLSMRVLIRLFGNTADYLIGANPELAGSDKFLGGLIQSVLQTLNFCAMAYIASSILYLWGIGAVTTAQQGQKLGAGVFNSMWVPVRHTLSFGLTVPVLNGFSVMQIIMMLCIGLSINLANAVWDFAGSYLANNIDIEVQNPSTSEYRADAAKLLPIFFKTTVASQILQDKALADLQLVWQKEYTSTDYEPDKMEGIAEYPIDYSGNFNIGGPLIRIDNYDIGIITIRQRDVSNAYFKWWEEWWSPEKAADPGMVQIEMPSCGTTWYGSSNRCEDTPEYKQRKDYAEQKVKRLVSLWAEMSGAADVYLHSYASAGDGCSVPPCVKGEEEAGKFLGDAITSALDEFEQGTQNDLKEAFDKYAEGDLKAKVERMVKNGVDNEDGRSVLGWMTAGLLPFTLSTVQENVNANFQAKAGGYNGSSTNTLLKLQEFVEDAETSEEKYMNQNYVRGMKNSVPFFRTYSDHEATYSMFLIANSGDRIGAKDWKEKLKHVFLGYGDNLDIRDKTINALEDQKTKKKHAGFLGWTLDKLSSYDPILVLQNFGTKLNQAASSFIFGAGAVGVALHEWQLFTICLGLFAAGMFFEYIVPFIPIVVWCKALISWLYLVVEAIIAAPIWVCAHAFPEGKGFAGNHARRGYFMFLNIMIRPTLLVISITFAFALIKIIGYFLSKMLNLLFIRQEFFNLGFFGDFCCAAIVMAMVYYAFYVIFAKGVLYLPDQIINWLGGAIPQMGIGGEEETLTKVMAINQIATSQGKQIAGMGASQIGGGINKLGKKVLGLNGGMGQIAEK